MKTVKHEIKLERSVKIILAVFAVGVLLNAFATPIGEELFGIKEALAANGNSNNPVYIVCLSGCQ
jgi:hypothetical protein